MRALLDRQISHALFGTVATTTNTAWSDKTLTLADIHATLAGLPKPETWVLSRLLAPRGRPVKVDAPDERFTILHPDDWSSVCKAFKQADLAGSGLLNRFALTATEIDQFDGDGAETAEWRAKLRKRVHDAVIGSMAATIELSRVFPPTPGQ